MARHALYLLVVALLVSTSSAASSGSKGNKAADKVGRSKLSVAPVCEAVKYAWKSYDDCQDFRGEVCDSIVKSESCDICGFLKDDDGCDLQTGEEVAADIAAAAAATLAQAKAYTDAQVAAAKTELKAYTDSAVKAAIDALFAKYTGGIVSFTVTGETCAVDGGVQPPGSSPPACSVGPGGTVIVVGSCAEGSQPVSIGCLDKAFPGGVVPGSSPAGNFVVPPVGAQCSYPAGTTEGRMEYVCIPIVAPGTAAAFKQQQAAAAKTLKPAPAGSRLAAIAAGKKP